MSTLESLCARLSAQTLDGQALIIPEAGLVEAVRQALERLNFHLGSAYTLAGLDGAQNSTLSAGAEYTLLVGARAYALSYLQANRSGNLLKPSDTLEQSTLLLSHLWRQFDAELDRLRLLALQSSLQPWQATWAWHETRGFSA